jgi:hypothetical protein
MTADAFADGAWHHAAATFDGNTAVLYVDGKVQAYAMLQLDTEGNRFVIGNAVADHAPEFWAGEIDQVHVYPRVLDGTEIGRLATL